MEYKSIFKENFIQNKKYASNYTITSIIDFVKKNQNMENPITVQFKGEKGNTKYLSLSLKDVNQIIDALQKKY